MKSLKIILYILVFSSCNTDYKNQIPDKVLIDVGFYPAFHLPIQVKILKNNDSGYLTCKVLGRDTLHKITAFDSVLLTKNDFDTFFKILDTVSLLKMHYETVDIGMDGITIDATIIQNEETNKFATWSPSRKEKPIDYKFLDAVFDLINKKLPKEENYIEDVQDYLSYGLGIKIKNDNPAIIKMYGGYTIFDATKLQLFFDSLPRDKPIIMDMSNFGGMGSILHDYFAVCDGTHEKMIWVTPGDWKEYFTRVGIDTNKMVSDIETARKMIGQ
jgi:hypothetical protein